MKAKHYQLLAMLLCVFGVVIRVCSEVGNVAAFIGVLMMFIGFCMFVVARILRGA